MLLRRLLALTCVLALLLPVLPVSALGLAPCVDECCADTCADACADENAETPTGDRDCPPECPDCLCSPLHRVATTSGEPAAEPPGTTAAAALGEPAPAVLDSDPREILHVPRG